MNNTEKIFAYYDQHAESTDGLYLDAVLEASEKWLDHPSAVELQNPEKEEIRKGIQLALLKGMKQSAQAHHQMTPDTIGFLIGYVINKLLDGKQPVTFLDPAAGTGNLLFTVLNQYKGAASASAVEIDDVLIQIAAATANLLELPVSFYLQDALRPLPIDLVDAVVSDIPVGYYPDDEVAMEYELMPAEGHAFSHYLYIEQSMRYVKPGGYGLFIVPSRLLSAEGAEPILNFVKDHKLLRGLLELPESLFSDQRFAKSILLLQQPPHEQFIMPDVLLAKIPELGNAAAMQRFFSKLNDWMEAEGE
ncbi:SAM-dependent methyltransferase [Sporosarcina sp. P37]|uniref:class I SAM-dependent methyltransferase n=1 Tax=unclassified Sporosarcina TaxID=2647733 RepID=UPI0009BE70A8|nr:MULTISPECIES: class I SAM-dependent methyltransferase [unclassified Sporosarcina]ARD47200.1 DNA methylase [Sporosarcina sp. P33]ARK23769.1 SAM-dependent methyltransferase [Sporosarcina sp. P37]PID18915.1 class I SAM-dependent methyltransferase [Sporosarcina sp. P35]